MESSQHHVGGVQRVDEVWWESILLFNCVRPPKKGENNSNAVTAVGTCTFMCSNMKRGFSWNCLASEVASLQTVPLAPVRQLAKQYCVCARYVLHKRAVPPVNVPIKIVQVAELFDKFLQKQIKHVVRALQKLLLHIHSSERGRSDL